MLTVPRAGEIVQLITVSPEPVTLGFKFVDCPSVSVVEDGESEMDTGTNEITTLALREEAAWLVAVIVTVSGELMGDGAV